MPGRMAVHAPVMLLSVAAMVAGLCGCTSSGHHDSSPNSPSAAASEPTVVSSTPPPTLGRPWPVSARGLGEVAPRVVHYGGDPTGLFEDVSWRDWGKPETVGLAMGWFVPAGQAVAGGRREPEVMVAFDLGECDGQLAYQHMGSFFPTEGEHFDLATARSESYDLCRGP